MELINNEKTELLAQKLQAIDVDYLADNPPKVENGELVVGGVIANFIGSLGTDIVVKYLLKKLASEETKNALHEFVYWLADKSNEGVDKVLDYLIEKYTI
jgi:hypothetical protein